jgi:carbon starvation protein CstA
MGAISWILRSRSNYILANTFLFAVTMWLLALTDKHGAHVSIKGLIFFGVVCVFAGWGYAEVTWWILIKPRLEKRNKQKREQE